MLRPLIILLGLGISFGAALAEPLPVADGYRGIGYFTNRKGESVWRLPQKMTAEFASPEVA